MQPTHGEGSTYPFHEIVEPAALSTWWPLAPGWWVMLALAAVASALWLARTLRRRRRNAYRRFALKELAEIARPEEVPVLLKRVALAAYPRELVARLSGDRWIAFLNHEVPACFDDQAASLLTSLDYSGRDLTRADHHRLVAAVRKWTLGHPSPEGARR